MSDVENDTDAESGAEGSYRVEIKRSARRRSAAAGEHVRREGRYRAFASKALAREWAREHSTPGGQVWIQDAVPTDSSPVDGYLVGGRRSSGTHKRAIRSSQASIAVETAEHE